MINWLKHSSFALAAGFVLLVLILAAFVSIFAVEHRDGIWVRHASDVDDRLTTVFSGLQDAESSQRGYVITGDAKYLEAYLEAGPRIRGDLQTLADLTQGDLAEQREVSRLRPLIEKRLDSLEIGVRLRREQGLQAAAAYISQGHGKILMDGIRRQLTVVRAQEDQLLRMRQAKDAGVRVAVRVMGVVGIFGLLTLTTLSLLASDRRLRELRESHGALAQANEQLTREVQARDRAEAQVRQMQKIEAVGQLTGGIAHDFNNMLSIIIGSLQLANRRVSSDPVRAQSCIDNALDAAKRAADLTARLLAFSRRQPLAPTPIDPNRLVGGMSELLRRTIGEQLRVETVLAGGLWRINVDGQQLENAILNLCVNARDAMPDGGKLTIETLNAFLDDAYAAQYDEVTPGQYVLISVTDTGVGMSSEVVQKAFEPFYTTKDVGQGTGLGLSQAFGFVKQSGGHMKIYSEVGRGTSVKIYLPRWAGEPAAGQQPVAAPDAATARAQRDEIVLVVEDQEQVRRVAVDTLRELGYAVVHANSGENALNLLQSQGQIDLLLTDIVMPGITGRELADQVIATRPDLKVLYMTGFSRNAVVHNGVLDAGVAFLQKPFTIEQLALKVRQVLDGQGSNRPAPDAD